MKISRSSPFPLLAMIVLAGAALAPLACGGNGESAGSGSGATAPQSDSSAPVPPEPPDDGGGTPGTDGGGAPGSDGAASDADADGSSDTSRVTQLGVNFNAGLSVNDVRFSELAVTKTGWVRGIINLLPLFDAYAAGQDWESDPNVVGYMTLKAHGYKTALSIRYHWTNANLPIPPPGSPAFEGYMAFLTSFLGRVMPGTDLVVAANEPFVEALPADKDSANLVAFYEEAATRIHTWLTAHQSTVPEYFGSFDDGWKPYRQNNASYTTLLKFARDTPWIAGVDLHIHHDQPKDITDVFDFVLPKIRASQRVLVTEYSLKPLWDSHREDPIAPAFIAAANADTGDDIQPPPPGIDQVWQYIDHATKSPRALAEWDAWNANTPWLEQSKHYLCSSFAAFSSHPQFLVGFYALRQGSGAGGFAATDGAWILNPILATATVAPPPGGAPPKRYVYFDDFTAMRSGMPTSCGP